jgi:hypothetical protein
MERDVVGGEDDLAHGGWGDRDDREWFVLLVGVVGEDIDRFGVTPLCSDVVVGSVGWFVDRSDFDGDCAASHGPVAIGDFVGQAYCADEVVGWLEQHRVVGCQRCDAGLR